MSLVHVIDISHRYSKRVLFEHVGFQVEPGDKIGLVGPNGAGKTTLLRLLCGDMPPESGTIRFSDGIRVGYLPQDIQESLKGDLLSSLLESIPGRVGLREEARRIEEALDRAGRPEKQERLANRLAEVHLEMGDLEIRYPAHEAEKILLGLGFAADELERPVETLSGGWKMRAALAALLYGKPDLMLLDEPTNHLDIPSVRWLEQFLDGFQGALVLVCHDRDFLNRRVNRILGFETEGLRLYNGNYDAYVKAREEEKRTLENRARNQEMKIREAQRFIERFRSKASKARQAQSKIKLVKKMEMVKTHRRSKTVKFRFPEVPRSGRVVVDFSGVSKRYGDHVLYSDLHAKVLRGERVAVIGPNGAGKTTLLRMVEGEVAPDAGEIRLGHEVTRSYYAQHHSEMLDPKRTVLEEVYRVVPHESVSFVRGVCGAFLFPGEDVDKAVGVLSGGEKARVCLARILVKPGNFLLMDEPTNHLDLLSSETLIEALAEYDGTLLFVSHNQAFVNRLATKIWDVRDGELVEYPGTLDEYYARMEEAEATLEARSPSEDDVDMGDDTPKSRKDMRKARAENRRKTRAALGPIESALRRTEERIHRLEARQKAMEQELADPEIFRDETRSVPLLKEYDRIKNDLDELMAEWEQGQERLESMMQEIDG